MRIDENQPDEFFPFLSRYVSMGGRFRCEHISPKAGGLLEFNLLDGERRITVVWSVSRAIESCIPFRDGGIVALGGDKSDQVAAIRQLIMRLKALFAQHTPLLIEKRNREIEDVAIGPDMLEKLFGRLLVPGETRCGEYVFADTALEGGALHFVFSGPERELVFALAAADNTGAGKVIARPGPFVLFALQYALDSEAELRAGHFLAYILDLGTHYRMQIVASSDVLAATDGVKMQATLNDFRNPNPFFLDEPLEWINKFNALFACEGRIVFISDCDRECNLYFQHHNGPAEYFNLAPWNIQPERKMALSFRSTDATEMDAIMTGCEDRLRSLIKEVACRERPQLIAVIDSCMSKLSGDSVTRVVESLVPELGGLPVLDLTMGTDNMWARLIEFFQVPRQSPPDASVNLIGFGHKRLPGLAELRSLLQAAGVCVNTCFIPSFNIDELHRFGDAALNVLYPSPIVGDYFHKVKPLCTAPILEPPAPYGFEGTRDWLNAIFRELDMELVSDECAEKITSQAADTWRALTLESSQFRISVVLMDNHFTALYMPQTRLGVPWLSCLDEMGFGIDLLVLETENTTRNGRPLQEFEELVQKFRRPASHRIIPVSSEQELQEILEGSSSSLVYTEVFNDRRVTTSGKTPFSVMDFEMGFAGALRTLERLLGYCRSQFYRRYKKHLKCEPVPRFFEKSELLLSRHGDSYH